VSRSAATPLRVVIEGTEMPGRRFQPDTGGAPYTNVHVGLCDRKGAGPPVVEPHKPWGVRDLVAGDADSARWQLDVEVRETPAGLDFTGPFVRGPRSDRHLFLAWGEVEGGVFRLFRGAKLRIGRVEEGIVRAALRPGRHLAVHLRLSDGPGDPRCATVETDLTWSDARSKA